MDVVGMNEESASSIVLMPLKLTFNMLPLPVSNQAGFIKSHFVYRSSASKVFLVYQFETACDEIPKNLAKSAFLVMFKCVFIASSISPFDINETLCVIFFDFYFV